MPDPFVFTRLYLPRPLDAERLEQLVNRLAASDVPRPLAFEVRADDSGIQHILGSTPTAAHQLKHLISGLLENVVFGPVTREPMNSAGRISARQTGLPVGVPDPIAFARAVYGALDARKASETLVLQIVLGRARSPEFVRPDVLDPLQSVPERLWKGTRAASVEIRRKMAQHAAEPRLQVTVRLGVAGPDAQRRQALVHRLFGALQSLQAVGVNLQLNREPARRLDRAKLGRPGMQLTPREIVTVLGWPLGEIDYPGIDPLHPKRLPVPKSVTNKESVFALGTAPGPERLVGITADARLSHLSVLAPTGAGKSEAVLAPLLLSDIKAGRPVVLVDPKGQLVDYVLDCLEPELADRVEIYDPSDPEGTAGFNPLDAHGRDPYAVVDSIMAVFKNVFADGWGPRTEDILHAALLTLSIDGAARDSPHTLLEVPRLLTDAAFRRGVTPAVAGELEIARFWARFDSLSPAQREHEIAAPMNKLRRYLMRRGITAILGQAKPAFRLRDIWKGNKVVLVALNDALSGVETSKLIGGLICAEVFMAAQERARDKDPKKRPGFVYVDEVRRFLHLPIPLESALEICRSYGVGWALFGQGSYQLGSGLAQTLEVNTKSQLTFATSADEARLIAKRAPQLSQEDIQLLPEYEIYANVMTGHGPSGWFSARTLPPTARLGHGGKVRDRCRQRYSATSTPAPMSLEATPRADSTPESHVKRRRA